MTMTLNNNQLAIKILTKAFTAYTKVLQNQFGIFWYTHKYIQRIFSFSAKHFIKCKTNTPDNRSSYP